MRIPAVLLALLLAGCVVVPAGPPPPPPGLISEQQAAQIATDFARSRGLQVWQVREVRLDRRGRYRVLLSGDFGNDRGRVLVDGYTGQVVRAKLRAGDRWEED